VSADEDCVRVRVCAGVFAWVCARLRGIQQVDKHMDGDDKRPMCKARVKHMYAVVWAGGREPERKGTL
jgi:hypothetical protein